MKKGTLYIVGTPIGDAADISLRAIETLQSSGKVEVSIGLKAGSGMHTQLEVDLDLAAVVAEINQVEQALSITDGVGQRETMIRAPYEPVAVAAADDIAQGGHV